MSVDVSLGKIYDSPGSSYAGSGNPMYGSGSESPTMSGQCLAEGNPKSQSMLVGESLGEIYNSLGFSNVEGSNPMYGNGSNGRPVPCQHRLHH